MRKKKLSKEEHHILREKGTEAPYTGKYYMHDEKGVYVCAGCGKPLFSSEMKLDSLSGWPSFFDAQKGSVEMKKDKSHLISRTEILCKNCGGHLGHVFNDGPKPTGKRFCVNSGALHFKKK
ncbi:peptide-methionine (R)-S-oxide reductase MsrB [Candidatus Woesearchaeota archaeon]|nr:peptide-methionine (R)-S-oxide reductase MsrB [Candidatus Woesearchaeota archaeon]